MLPLSSMASEVVDLTFSDDEDLPQLSASIAARRASPLPSGRATKPGRSPARQPLSPLHNRSPGGGTPKLGRGPAVARGLGEEHAPAGERSRRKSLQAILAVEDSVAAERDMVGGQR